MPFSFTPRKNRNHVRKNSISAITSHRLYVSIVISGKKLFQINPCMSNKINMPNTIVKAVRVTINLLGGVQPIYYSLFILIFFVFFLKLSMILFEVLLNKCIQNLRKWTICYNFHPIMNSILFSEINFNLVYFVIFTGFFHND